ncbi:hypothetical protein Tco_0393016 [Tanacetum coccineum]
MSPTSSLPPFMVGGIGGQLVTSLRLGNYGPIDFDCFLTHLKAFARKVASMMLFYGYGLATSYKHLHFGGATTAASWLPPHTVCRVVPTTTDLSLRNLKLLSDVVPVSQC